MGNPGPQLWKVVGSVAAKKRREGGRGKDIARCMQMGLICALYQPTDRPRPRPTSRRSTVQSAKRKRITPQSQTFLDSPSAVNYIAVRQMMRWWHTPPLFSQRLEVAELQNLRTRVLSLRNHQYLQVSWTTVVVPLIVDMVFRSQIIVAMFASLLISPREI